MALKDNIKIFRERKELSQQQLTDLIGVNQAMIHYIESGIKVSSLGLQSTSQTFLAVHSTSWWGGELF
ncbi:MAG: helix-turn-helix transcriptional regulator [bacterium]